MPGRILDSEETAGIRIGRVQFGEVTRQVCLDLAPDANVGDYVLVHAGVAITRVDEAEARRTLAMLEQIGLLDEELTPGADG